MTFISQPSARIEPEESPEQAAVRAALQETGCEVAVSGLLGVYLWIQPQTRQQYLRIVYAADLKNENATSGKNPDVLAVHWYSVAELRNRMKRLSSPIVLRCVEDFAAGKRARPGLLAGLQPVQKNISSLMANARLV